MALFTNRKHEEGEPGVAGLTDAASTLAQFGIAIDADLPVPGGITDAGTSAFVDQRRRLEDQPRAQAGNIEIDATGLRSMLGVSDDASLLQISAARQRFLADHEPHQDDDSDAVALKERIRREVNTAYATFRLTHGD